MAVLSTNTGPIGNWIVGIATTMFARRSVPVPTAKKTGAAPLLAKAPVRTQKADVARLYTPRIWL